MLKNILSMLLLVLSALILGCSGSGNRQVNEQPNVKQAAVEVNSEALLLMKNLEEAGDYVNSRNFPSLIKAAAVYKELGANNLIIDLRKSEDFAKGHINGAANIQFAGVPTFFESKIKPFEYGKIIFVCYSGQASSYVTSLFRLMGYGNVYAMRWGMSSWNNEFAKDSWLKEISSAYEDKLETTENKAAEPDDLPLLNTGKTSGDEIREVQFKKLVDAGTDVALISAAEVFQNPEKYYIINFERKDKYDAGHIPGAKRYKQSGTLGILAEMQTIPSGSEVVVYCGTGHNSGFATAYLRLFGYNAKTLSYGNNAFMHNQMVKDKVNLSWLPFTPEEINNFPFVKN